MRYDSRAVRRMASLMFVLQTLLYEAVAIYAPALALAAVTNMPVWVSILTVAAIGSVYTAIVSQEIWVCHDSYLFLFSQMLSGSQGCITTCDLIIRICNELVFSLCV